MTATGWQAIAAEALRRINTRIWPPGSMVPAESDLAAEFGVARATVNRALRALAEDGWLDRRRKAGTRVALHPVRRATLRIPVIRAEVTAAGATYAHRLLSRTTAPAPETVTQALSLPPGSPLLHVTALHLANASPWAAEDRWINPAAVPAIAMADLTATSANEWLVTHAPFTHGDYAIAATAATPAQAAQLACPPDAALLTVTRTTWDGPRPITWVCLTHAPDHKITASL